MPKDMEKKLELQKKREMREKQKLEREKSLQEERELRESRKKEKEEKKKEREEKEKALKEQRRKEKELKEKQKLTELEQKQKEKEAKEEDRRKREEAREEERKRKAEEKLESERKKQKTASNFKSFFVPKKPTETKLVEEEKVVKSYFMPFEVKADMRIAPVTRRNLTNEEKIELEKLMSKEIDDKSTLYLSLLKNNKLNPRKSKRTWPVETIDDDVILLENSDENIVKAGNATTEKHHVKLLFFNENRRPPYWGTWRKKSNSINPRRPFTMDTKYFDYEVDSDDEWEEEEPGESLHGSDDEKEEKEEDPDDNEYDVDNDFMVPHGYLSDEEILADEEEGEEDDDVVPEEQKSKLKMLNEQFELERKQKTTKLQPKVIGCVWLKADNTYPESASDYVVRFLTARQAWVRQIPLSLTAPADGDLNGENAALLAKQAAASARKAEILEEAVPDLIRLLHGNTNSINFLLKEFLEFWSKKKEDKMLFSKIKLKKKIQEIASYIACPEPGVMYEKLMWFVHEEIRKKYLSDEVLSLPNNWEYILTPKKKVKQLQNENHKEKEKKNSPLITQFTKTLTAQEMQKQLNEKPTTPLSSKQPEDKSTTTPVLKTTPLSSTRPPKRVALISVARGDSLPKSPRVSLIDMFASKTDSNIINNKKSKLQGNLDNDDDIQIIDHDEDKNNDDNDVKIIS